jgi:hypothetical protein
MAMNPSGVEARASKRQRETADSSKGNDDDVPLFPKPKSHESPMVTVASTIGQPKSKADQMEAKPTKLTIFNFGYASRAEHDAAMKDIVARAPAQDAIAGSRNLLIRNSKQETLEGAVENLLSMQFSTIDCRNLANVGNDALMARVIRAAGVAGVVSIDLQARTSSPFHFVGDLISLIFERDLNLCQA